MKLKNLLLGASIVICGAAFGQDEKKVYIKKYDVMLRVSSCDITQDADGNTTFNMNIIGEVPGEQPNEPQGMWYLGRPGGYTGPGGPNQTVCGNSSSQCVWTSWQ